MTLLMIIDIFLWIACGFWFWMTIKASREVLGLRRLPQIQDSMGDEPPLSSVTVIVPVRDGVDQIETTLDGLLAQTGVQLDIIVVDDRSTDGTGALIDQISEREERVSVIHIEVLPEGWLGKCHALHLGSRSARGEWILFADADLRMKTDTVEQALLLARREQVQHVSALFRPRNPNPYAEACFNNMYLAAHCAELGGINRDRPGAFGGLGAFNLVCSDAFREVNGYEPLRLSVCDDSRLGKLLREGGFRSRLFVGPEVTADWGNTVTDNIKLFEKNMFASVDYRTIHAFLATLVFFLFPWAIGVAGVFFGLFTGSLAGFAASTALASTVLPALLLAIKSESRQWPAILTPLMWPILGVAMLNSAWVTLRQGGIRWRDTFYSLSQLRDHTLV